MAGGKLPPRQKMIGLMYLVLLALLAMNVSKSILDSFVVINDGIEVTTKTFDASNENLYRLFEKARQNGGAKWADKADKVKADANDLYTHIEGIKKKMYELVDAIPPEVADTIPLASISAKDNYDMPSALMGLADPATPTENPLCPECSSTLLKEKLIKYKADLIEMFGKEDQEMMTKKLELLSTNEIHAHDGNKPWEVGMFYHNPLAAVVTTLSKIQSDIRTAEAQVINKLYENIDAGGVSFNAVRGMAVMPKAYIMDGDSFSAEIFTAAYDDRTDPEIYITTAEYDTAAALAVEKSGTFDVNAILKGTKGEKWGDGDWYQMTKEEISAGKGNLKVREGIGVHNWGGLIKLNTKKGPKVYTFSSSFEVGKPSTTIAASKMNVFYIGVDNPVSVSAPMPNFTASGPGLSKSSKGYVMRPRKPGKVTISVSGTDENGKKVALGKQEFRVKRIPDPKSYVGGKSGSTSIKKAQLKAASTVQAKMEGFDFDLRVSVKSFVFSTTKAGDIVEFKVSGNKLNSKCKKLIATAKRNQKFYIEKIKVTMPDKTTRELAPVILKSI